MRILERYIARHVIAGTGVALLILVTLFSVIEFVDDVHWVGRGEYTMLGAFEHLALTIPGRLFAILPVSALIGSVMGLGLLTSSNELTVMRASGVSVAGICVAVLKAGALLVVLAVVIGELVVPHTERIAHEARSVAINKSIALRSNYGLWIRDRLSFISIRTVLPDSQLAGIDIYEFDDRHRLRVATHAERARYTGEGWALEGIAQSEIADEGVTTRRIERAVWNSLLGPDEVNAVPIEPEGLSVAGLLTYLRFLRDNGLSTERYELALWNKFVYPFATGVMVFVSVVLVLGPLRAVGLGQRIMIGIAIGIVFHIIQKTTMHAGLVYQTGPVFAVLGPPLVFLVFGVWLLRRLS